MKRAWMLTVLMLAGCGEEPQTEATAEATLEPSAAIAPTAAVAGAELVPAYPGAVPVDVPNLGVPGTDSRSGNTSASETVDSPVQVAQFYRERFAAAGVPIRVDSVTETGGAMGVGRDGEQGAMLTIVRPGAKTRIMVILGR